MVLKSISNMKKVWKITKKPTKKEYFLTVKIVLIGFLIIGFLGFLIQTIWIVVLNSLFKQ